MISLKSIPIGTLSAGEVLTGEKALHAASALVEMTKGTALVEITPPAIVNLLEEEGNVNGNSLIVGLQCIFHIANDLIAVNLSIVVDEVAEVPEILE